MNDLTHRLRKLRIIDEVGSDNPLGRDAADRIEADEDLMRQALKALDYASSYCDTYPEIAALRERLGEEP